MSIWGRRVSIKLVITAVVIVLLSGFAIAVTRPAPRQITLVARGMVFYLEDGDVPNPTLTVRAGERVRVVFRNLDRGILHDFTVPGLHAALDPVGWNASDDVTFDVPETPGIYEYHCRPHMMMMRGKIIVE